jgi:hypothetical protein
MNEFVSFYPCMKEGRLFCSYEIHGTRMLWIVFLMSLESAWQGGVHGLGGSMTVWTWGAKVLEYWTISSLKIELSPSWKFQRDWNVTLVSLERSWWAQFNRIHLVIFGFRMCEILDFKGFMSLKIQINSKRPGFGRKNQLRASSHLAPRHRPH